MATQDIAQPPTCPVCKDHKLSLPFDPSKGYWHTGFKASLASLRTASSSCLLCNAVLSIFIAVKNESEPHSDEMEFFISSLPGVPMVLLWPDYSQHGPNMPKTRVEVEVFTPVLEEPKTVTYVNGSGFEVHRTIPDPSVEPWPIIPRWVPISKHSMDEDALRVARGFIEKCKSDHGERCNSHGRKGFVPTRLVDVREFGQGKCRISFSQEVVPAPYTALSYCWGGDQPHKTTTTNVAERISEGFDVSILPLTIREAVEFTFKLGIPYMWVDSLCIIQDDHEDWSHEASLMGSVYEAATLTIAADHSSTASSGLFMGHSLAATTNLSIPGPGGKNFTISARPKGGLCAMMVSVDDSDTTNPNVRAYPLATRGWTLQERMLSSRILHFTDREMQWECKSAFLCECLGPQAKERGSQVSMNVLENLASGRADFSKSWRMIVENFSRRKLTRESDKLPALTGLINRMGTIYQSTSNQVHSPEHRRCLSGLWEEGLAAQLCWYSSYSIRGKVRQSRVTTFPSWSWASVDGPLIMQPSMRRGVARSRRSQEKVTLGPMVDLNDWMPTDHYIRPLELAARGEEETRRILAIPEQDRTVDDKKLLDYINYGECNEEMDYTSWRVQTGRWQHSGYIALLLGEHIGSSRDLEGKYKWPVTFSHWMILAPVEDGNLSTGQGITVYERVAMTKKNGLFTCRLRPEAVEREVTIV